MSLLSSSTSYGPAPKITLIEDELHFSLVDVSDGIELSQLRLEDEGLGGEIVLHVEKESNRIVILVIPDYKERICWERTQLRYSSQKDMLYFSFCPTNRQEYSLELESFDDKVIFDFDEDDKIIGFCILDVVVHCYNSACLKVLPDHKWVQMNGNKLGNASSSRPIKKSTNNSNANASAEQQLQVSVVTNESLKAGETETQGREGHFPPTHLTGDDNATVTNFANVSIAGADANANAECFLEANDLKLPRGEKKKDSEKNISDSGNSHTKVLQKGFSLIPGEIKAHANNSTAARFLQPVVRDICWVITSPAMLVEDKKKHANSNASSTTADVQPAELDLELANLPRMLQGHEKELSEWLDCLDANPKPFYEWAETKKSRSNILGGYFLLLIQFWLEMFMKMEKVQTKFQLSDGIKTVGDMDILYYDPNTRCWNHWELGIKFYLIVETTPPESSRTDFENLCLMVGPYGGGESLLSYVLKTQKQLQVKELDVVSQYLRSENIYPEISRFLIKGFLFLPLTEHWYENIGQHRIGWDNRFLNEDQNLGWWVRFPTYSHPKRELVLDARKKLKERDAAIRKNRKMRKYNNYDDFEVKISEVGDSSSCALADSGGESDGATAAEKTDERGSLSVSQSSVDEEDVGETDGARNGNNTNDNIDGSVFEDILLYNSPYSTEIKQKKLQQSKFLILAKGNYFSKVFLTAKDLVTAILYDYQEIHEKIKELFLESNKAILLAEVVPIDTTTQEDKSSSFENNPEGATNPILYVEESRGWIVRNDWKSNVV